MLRCCPYVRRSLSAAPFAAISVVQNGVPRKIEKTKGLSPPAPDVKLRRYGAWIFRRGRCENLNPVRARRAIPAKKYCGLRLFVKMGASFAQMRTKRPLTSKITGGVSTREMIKYFQSMKGGIRVRPIRSRPALKPGLMFLLAFALTDAVLLEFRPSLSGVPLAVLFVSAAALQTGAGLFFLYRALLPLRKAMLTLPPAVQKKLDGLPPEEQLQSLCELYAHQAESLGEISVRRLLEKLLEDNSHTQAMEDLPQQIGAILHGEAFGYRWRYYCLVNIRVEDYSSYTLKNCNGHLLFDDLRRMYDAVTQAFRTALNARQIAHCVERQNSIVFLVNLNGTTEDSSAAELGDLTGQVTEACRTAIEQVWDTFNLRVEVAVSAPYDDVTQTHSNFEWLVTMQKYCMFIRSGQPLLGPRDFDEMIAPAGQVEQAELEKHYYGALLSENYPEARRVLLELDSSYLRQPPTPPDIGQLKTVIWVRLRSALLMCNSGRKREDQSRQLVRWERAIRSAQTMDELSFLIDDFFHEVDTDQQKLSGECSGTAKKILEFLDKNYFFPDLSMSVLSDALCLSQSYISRIFKRETGQNIPDYIHSLRIRHAKTLLAETESSISEIAEKVGYTTAWTMNRAFKRYENMTPGCFRQMCREEGRAEEQ